MFVSHDCNTYSYMLIKIYELIYFRQYFTAATFVKLLREDEVLSRINILTFFNYVMKKVWLQQTHVGISLYDVCGEGYLRETDLENYMLELIPTLCQVTCSFYILS